MKRLALFTLLAALFFGALSSALASNPPSKDDAVWSQVTYSCTQSSGKYHLTTQHADLVYHTSDGKNLQTTVTETTDTSSGHSSSTFPISYTSHGQTVDTYDYYYPPVNSASLPITLAVDVKSLDSHGKPIYETSFTATCNRTSIFILNASISSHDLPLQIQAISDGSIGIVHP